MSDRPRAAILLTGSELVRGAIRDANGPFLARELTRLGIDGVELIDTAPRRGAEGPVAFLHPRSCHGVLVELIEAHGGPAWKSLGYQA